jgi:hypothetical protein
MQTPEAEYALLATRPMRTVLGPLSVHIDLMV